MAIPGIFCLEGNWSVNGDLTNRESVENQLRMLENARSCDVIHRDVATQDEFDHYLAEWLKKKYSKYSLAYLAFHGAQNSIFIGNAEVTLDELATRIGKDKATGRILYFGSCSTMAATEAELRAFCRATGAKALVGYTRRIAWFESAAFDCLLLPRLLNATLVKPIFTSLDREYPDFVRRLGLRIATSAWATPRKIAAAAIDPSH